MRAKPYGGFALHACTAGRLGIGRRWHDGDCDDSAETGTVNEDEERNKALVIEAFDALFNKRDYAAAERFLHTTTTSRQRQRCRTSGRRTTTSTTPHKTGGSTDGTT